MQASIEPEPHKHIANMAMPHLHLLRLVVNQWAVPANWGAPKTQLGRSKSLIDWAATAGPRPSLALLSSKLTSCLWNCKSNYLLCLRTIKNMQKPFLKGKIMERKYNYEWALGGSLFTDQKLPKHHKRHPQTKHHRNALLVRKLQQWNVLTIQPTPTTPSSSLHEPLFRLLHTKSQISSTWVTQQSRSRQRVDLDQGTLENPRQALALRKKTTKTTTTTTATATTTTTTTTKTTTTTTTTKNTLDSTPPLPQKQLIKTASRRTNDLQSTSNKILLPMQSISGGPSGTANHMRKQKFNTIGPKQLQCTLPHQMLVSKQENHPTIFAVQDSEILAGFSNLPHLAG